MRNGGKLPTEFFATFRKLCVVGRNFDEIVRVVDALQTVDQSAVACPANWRPGDDVIVPAPMTMKGAEERAANKELKVTDWYLSKKKLS